MLKRIKTLLQKAGLQESEVQLFIALLQLQSATLQELASATCITEISTHRMLKKLQERGLVLATPLNKKQYIYSPLSLISLIKSLEKDQRTMQKLLIALKDVQSMLPRVNMESLLYESETLEPIEIKEGIDAMYEEYLKLPQLGNSEFLAIGSSDNFWKATGASIDSPLERSFVQRRLANNVYSRIVMRASADAEKIAAGDSKEKRITKQKKEIPVMDNMMMICGDQVSHFVCDAENPRVLIIREPSFVELQKKNFEMIWGD